jgi:SAM-dependent methyltransferase
MLENYEKMPNGVIKQIKYNPVKYDKSYSMARYDSYGELSNYMSYLRYGYLIGILKFMPNSILDIGYGNGDFLKVCQKKIKKCYGNDISDYPIPKGCKFIKYKEIFKKEFDVTCFFDSLEHFPDISFIKQLKTSYIIISIPNCHYFSDDWFKNWKHHRPDIHLWYFNNVSLCNFMSDMGYNMLNLCNIEDIIRTPGDKNDNILTGIFEKCN